MDNNDKSEDNKSERRFGKLFGRDKINLYKKVGSKRIIDVIGMTGIAGPVFYNDEPIEIPKGPTGK